MMKQAVAIPHRPMHPSCGLLRLLVCLICFSFVQPFAGQAQANAPGPMPTAAQEALNKGIIAAKVPDYLLALRYFKEARKLAPDAPVVYLNTGLAESRIAGRELRAIAWFGAYLAVYPDAPNAAAVREQIAVLDTRNQSSVSRLLKTAQDVADQISGTYHEENLLRVVKLWLDSGDMTAALKAANLIKGKNNRAEYWRSMAQLRVASAQANAGDIAGSQKTADLIQNASEKSSALVAIAKAKIKGGDLAGAKTSFAAAVKTAGHINSEASFSGQTMDYKQAQTQSGIARAQAETGSIVDARITVDLITDEFPLHKILAQTAIAEAQIKVGDIAGAKITLMHAEKAAALLQDGNQKNHARTAITEFYAKSDITNAPNSTHQIMSAPQPLILPLITADDWLKKLDDDNESNPCPLSTEPFLDLTGHLNALPSPSNDLHAHAWALLQTAEKIVSARNAIIGMLKQEAGN